MKESSKKVNLSIYRVGVIAQIMIIASLVLLEANWGAAVQQDLPRGIYCLVFFSIFFYVMFDLYVLNKRNTTLKTTGPFALSRHPVYVCLFMISLSYWFSVHENILYIYFLQAILWVSLIVASLVQERVILEKYGQEAEDYYKRTPRFILF